MNELQKAIRFVLGIFAWAWDKAWTQPARIRGKNFTLALWTHVACGFYFASIIAASGKDVLIPLVLYYGTAWFMSNQKPKKLGRPLPYRRKR